MEGFSEDSLADLLDTPKIITVDGAQAYFRELKERRAEELALHSANIWKVQAFTEEKIEEYVYHYTQDSASRPWAFLNIALTGRIHPTNVFWKCVMKCWSGFDRVPHLDYQKLFQEYGRYWSPDLMSEAANSFYDGLPEKLLVQRGHGRSRIYGLSFTTDVDIAKSFARGHRSLWNCDPVIMTRSIKKSDIAFVCVDRNESELVLWRGGSGRLVSIISASEL